MPQTQHRKQRRPKEIACVWDDSLKGKGKTVAAWRDIISNRAARHWLPSIDLRVGKHRDCHGLAHQGHLW
jgi:hypothetical protein